MEIGGYFGLELSDGYKNYHSTPYKLKSGRAALGFILSQLKPTLVYVPFYTCNALLEPFETLGIPYQFYAIDENLELSSYPELNPQELIIYINYYDVKRDYAEKLSERYGGQLIIDCTQAFFVKGNGRSWYLNSIRKFFGVPDGCDLYVPEGYNFIADYNALRINTDYLTEHLVARFRGDTQLGYEYFKRNEVLNGKGITKMSYMSSCLLSTINYKKASESRQRNFRYLHQQIGRNNTLSIKDPFSPAPSFYPYLPAKTVDKKVLWASNIFVPIFWQDCQNREEGTQFPFETELSNRIIPIPIDHRYQPADYDRLLSILTV